MKTNKPDPNYYSYKRKGRYRMRAKNSVGCLRKSYIFDVLFCIFPVMQTIQMVDKHNTIEKDAKLANRGCCGHEKIEIYDFV